MHFIHTYCYLFSQLCSLFEESKADSWRKWLFPSETSLPQNMLVLYLNFDSPPYLSSKCYLVLQVVYILLHPMVFFPSSYVCPTNSSDFHTDFCPSCIFGTQFLSLCRGGGDISSTLATVMVIQNPISVLYYAVSVILLLVYFIHLSYLHFGANKSFAFVDDENDSYLV